MNAFVGGDKRSVTSLGNSSSINLVLPVIVLHVVRLGTSHYSTLSRLSACTKHAAGSRVGAMIDPLFRRPQSYCDRYLVYHSYFRKSILDLTHTSMLCDSSLLTMCPRVVPAGIYPVMMGRGIENQHATTCDTMQGL
jgi:hypothetical protein